MTSFAALHDPSNPLVLPNAWDVASARLIEDAGAAAIATTSGGVAWSLGAPDGDRLDRGRAVGLVARIAAAVRVPVTADIESGFADTPDGVAETARLIREAGAAGFNLEDTHHGSGPPSLRDADAQCERIEAAAQAGLFVNARVDTYLTGRFDDEAARRSATIERAEAYLRAGANGIFVPGTTDPDTVAALAKAIDAPLNVMAGPGAPPVAELGRLGVARISVGVAIALAAYAVAQRAATELLTTGTYETLSTSLGYGQLNGLLG